MISLKWTKAEIKNSRRNDCGVLLIMARVQIIKR